MKTTLLAILAIMFGTGGWAAGSVPVIDLDRKAKAGIPAISPAACVDAITIPRMLNYQGNLLDAVGGPVPDTAYFVQFALYADSSGGSSFWSELQTVRTRDGRFTVLLGAVTPIESFPSAGSCFLGMRVNADPEMTPRLRIVSAAYVYLAERAANADRLQGRDTAALDARFVNEGQAAGGELTGSYPNPGLAQQGASAGQVLKWTGSAWQPANDSVGQGGGSSDNAWVRGTPDSVLFTIRRLGLARGGSDNMLYGDYPYTHVNLGVACTTGESGQNRFYSTVGGGQRNTAGGNHATVAGGKDCRAGSAYSGVLSGVSNQAGTAFVESAATVCGGKENIAGALCATIGGGAQNRANVPHSAISGGLENTIDGEGGAIGGGYQNYVYGEYGSIGGGYRNETNNDRATVGGGFSNTAAGSHSTVSGGNSNVADGHHATVGGGWGNVGSGGYSAVGGGYANATYGMYATIGGGKDDTVRAVYGGVLSGRKNTAGSDLSDTGIVVCGGADNRALAKYATISGGVQNVSDGSHYYATIGGGIRNHVGGLGQSATIAGGEENNALGDYSTVAGGLRDSAAGDNSTVGGGYRNLANGHASTVGGGWNNAACGEFGGVLSGANNMAGRLGFSDSGTVVCGGVRNRAQDELSFVGGGAENIADAVAGTVAGGYNNQVWNQFGLRGATIGGGFSNEASQDYTTIGGGAGNHANGPYATVAGGWRCVVGGSYGFAAGDSSIVNIGDDNSAALNGQITTASYQLRCGILSKVGGTFTIDHPLDPAGKILNHYFIEGPEMLNIYRGSAVLDASGRAKVELPAYFSELNRTPMVQLTGVGRADAVYVAEKVSGNRFVIGGPAGMEVYWQVTGERKDTPAEALRRMMPVEQPKTGGLRGRSLDDDFLVGALKQLEREGKAQGIEFRTEAGRMRYEDMKRHAEGKE